ERLARLLIGAAEQGLGSQMEHQLWPSVADRLTHGSEVAHIADYVRGQTFLGRAFVEQIWLRRRLQGVAVNLSPHLGQPQHQPAPLKTGVPRDEDALVVEELFESVHDLCG